MKAFGQIYLVFEKAVEYRVPVSGVESLDAVFDLEYRTVRLLERNVRRRHVFVRLRCLSLQLLDRRLVGQLALLARPDRGLTPGSHPSGF